MSDRPTPETDAFQASGKAHYMACDFARRLERERDEAREKLLKLRRVTQELRGALKEMCDGVEEMDCGGFLLELNQSKIAFKLAEEVLG